MNNESASEIFVSGELSGDFENDARENACVNSKNCYSDIYNVKDSTCRHHMLPVLIIYPAFVSCKGTARIVMFCTALMWPMCHQAVYLQAVGVISNLYATSQIFANNSKK